MPTSPRHPPKPVEPKVQTHLQDHALPVATCVMGLDLSLTSTALTIFIAGQAVTKRFAPGSLRGLARLAWLRDQIVTEVLRYQAQLIVIEGYSFGSANSHAHSLGELGGIIKLTLGQIGVPMAIAAKGCWLKAITGSGASKGKGTGALELFKRFGIELPQDDMADSASLAVVAGMLTGQITPPTKDHAAGLAKIEYVAPLPLPKVRERARPNPPENPPEKSATGLQMA